MIDRTLTSLILEAKASFPVLSITGPRQSGKTTLARACFPSYAYLNLEAPDIRLLAEEDPRGFISRYLKRGVIVDEAQRVPALFSYLQQIADEAGAMGRIILTGSQNFLLLEKITESLAGRTAVLHLLPFTVREYPSALDGTVDRVLFSGMYPPLHDRRIDPNLFYPSYIQTYIERDVRSMRNIGSLSDFTRFLRLCAGRVGSLLNMSSLAVETGVDQKTVKSWLSVLEAGFIVFFLKPHYRNFNKRIVKQPKLYFYDTGLVCSLLGLESPDQVSTHYLRGGIFENFCLSEYRKMRLHAGKQPNMYFWRDNTGTEIDLIIEDGERIDAVELKSGATVTQELTRSLRKYAVYSGLPPERLHVVYGGETSYEGKNARFLSWRAIRSLPGVE